jgi:hypothetical protein
VPACGGQAARLSPFKFSFAFWWTLTFKDIASMRSFNLGFRPTIDKDRSSFSIYHMRHKLPAWFFPTLAVCFVLFSGLACKKSGALVAQAQPAQSPEALKQQRLEWNLKTLVAAYQTANHTNARWDASATLALTEFAHARARALATNEAWAEIIATNAAAAVRAGCDDPLVNYLFIKFALPSTNSAKTYADDFCRIALAMNQSSYPSVRKCYATAATIDQLFLAYGTNTANQPVARQVMPLMGQNLIPAMADKTMPATEAYELAERALYLVSGDKNGYKQAYHCVEQPMFDNWPNDSLAWLLKGSSYVQMAWLARGGGYADKVSQPSWITFFADLAVADEALTNAWNLNPNDERIPIQMIGVAEGRQKSRAEMELWFQRAMAINPDCYEACEDKLHYLYPQWYGSRDDMIAFGRECADSTNWGGNVPLILSDAHREYWLYLDDPELKTNYWKRPDVWPDIEKAFDRFFELNPNETAYYHNYAWYAYQCQQWEKFNELVPKLDQVNYDYFGGKDEFDKMVQFARENVKASKLGEQK